MEWLLLAAALLPNIQTPKVLADSAPTNGDGSYQSGKYRNLFAEDGHAEHEIHAKIDAAYQQLFHGDPQTQAIAFAASSNGNGPLMYVTDWANHDVRTEGMSYGMMITVQLNKKSEFDAIWNWAKTYMYISDPKSAELRVLRVVVQNRRDAQLRGRGARWGILLCDGAAVCIEPLGRREGNLRLSSGSREVTEGDGASGGNLGVG